MDRGAWWATVQRVKRVRHDWSDLVCMHRNLKLSFLLLRTVSINLRFHNKAPQTCGLNDRYLFLHSLKLGIQGQDVSRVGFSYGLSPWPPHGVLMSPFLSVSIIAVSSLSYKDTSHIGWEPHPVISFNLVTSIMVLYPNITNLGVKASTQQFGEHNAVYNNNPFSSAWPGTRKYYSICWLQTNQGCEWNELVHWKIFHLSESVFLLGKQESWYIYIHKYVYMYIYAVRMGVLEMFARWVLNKQCLSLWTISIILDTPGSPRVQWSPQPPLRSIYLEGYCTWCYVTKQPPAWHLGQTHTGLDSCHLSCGNIM